jgi:hypothetical protein
MFTRLRAIRVAAAGIGALVGLAAGTSTAAGQDRAIAIRGGTVLPISGPAIPNGTVLVQGGKIVAVGANLAVPGGAEIVDARGKYVMPGVVDAMSSIGISPSDLNDAINPITPAQRVIESYYPYGQFGQGRLGPLRNEEALSGGVTTMYIAPADAALLGGQGVSFQCTRRLCSVQPVCDVSCRIFLCHCLSDLARRPDRHDSCAKCTANA